MSGYDAMWFYDNRWRVSPYEDVCDDYDCSQYYCEMCDGKGVVDDEECPECGGSGSGCPYGYDIGRCDEDKMADLWED